MYINIAIAPIGWKNDDLPELGGDTSIKTCVREASEAGYIAMEKGGHFPASYEDQRALMDPYKIRMIGGWHSGNLIDGTVEEEKKRVAHQLDLYQKWECPVMVYGETGGSIQLERNTPISKRNIRTQDELKAYADRLSEFGEWLKSEGCPISYHHHMVTVVETPEETDFIMANTSNDVGLLWDTGHYYFAGGNPTDLAKKWGHRINYVHLKDVRQNVLDSIDKDKNSFIEAVIAGIFTVPGDGVIDFNAVAQALKDINYNGWVCVEAEQDPAQANPLEYSRKGREYMIQCLSNVGYTVK